MCVCLVRVNSPVPTVIETGFGTSWGAGAGGAEAGGAEAAGGEEMDMRYPAATTKRETIGRGLRRRLDMLTLPLRAAERAHRHPEAVRFPTRIGLHPCAQCRQDRLLLPGSSAEVRPGRGRGAPSASGRA